MNRPLQSDVLVAARRGSLKLLAALLLLPALAGCPPPVGPAAGTGGVTGSGGAPGSGTGGGGVASTGGSGAAGTPCDAVNKVFKPSCGGAECHSNGSLNGVFAVDDPERSLIEREPAFSTGANCSDEFFIYPRLPLEGALFKRISGDTCGRRMPPSAADGNMNPPAPADYVDCIRSWAASKLPPP